MKIFVLNLLNHPLDQFEIVSVLTIILCDKPGNILPVEATFITNLTLTLFFIVFIFRLVFGYIFNNGNSTIIEIILFKIFALVRSICYSNTSLSRNSYFTIWFFLFSFILGANLSGLIPYSFTITSSFIVTFFLALMHFIGINLIGLIAQKWHISNLFLPSGVPIGIAPFLIIIEMVSYFAKVFSLSIRLFANMMSGHALLKILTGFSWGLLNTGFYFGIIAFFPWLIVNVIMFLEALIAFLQAYVFTTLLTIYLNDTLSDH